MLKISSPSLPPLPRANPKNLNASACVDVLKGAARNRRGVGDEKSQVVEIKREKMSTKDKAANQDRPACICSYPHHLASLASSSSSSLLYWTCWGQQLQDIKISRYLRWHCCRKIVILIHYVSPIINRW